jgi:hypothetical protein
LLNENLEHTKLAQLDCEEKNECLFEQLAFKEVSSIYRLTMGSRSDSYLLFVAKFELSELRNQMNELEVHKQNRRDSFTQTLKNNCFMFDKANQTSLKMFDIYTQTNQTQVFKSSCAVQCQLTIAKADNYTQTDSNSAVSVLKATMTNDANQSYANRPNEMGSNSLLKRSAQTVAKAHEPPKNDINSLLKRSFNNYTNRKQSKNEIVYNQIDDQSNFSSVSNKRVRFSETERVFEINEVDNEIDYDCPNKNF